MAKFDSMGFTARAFINEYGMETYRAWRESKIPLPSYEKDLRKSLGYMDDLLPVTTASRNNENNNGY